MRAVGMQSGLAPERDSLLLSWHAQMRGAQRAIPDEVVQFVAEHGRALRAGHAVHYFFGRRELQRLGYERVSAIGRCEGVVVVASQDGSVLTTYRNPKALKKIRRLGRVRPNRRRREQLLRSTPAKRAPSSSLPLPEGSLAAA